MCSWHIPFRTSDACVILSKLLASQPSAVLLPTAYTLLTTVGSAVIESGFDPQAVLYISGVQGLSKTPTALRCYLVPAVRSQQRVTQWPVRVIFQWWWMICVFRPAAVPPSSSVKKLMREAANQKMRSIDCTIFSKTTSVFLNCPKQRIRTNLTALYRAFQEFMPILETRYELHDLARDLMQNFHRALVDSVTQTNTALARVRSLIPECNIKRISR